MAILLTMTAAARPVSHKGAETKILTLTKNATTATTSTTTAAPTNAPMLAVAME